MRTTASRRGTGGRGGGSDRRPRRAYDAHMSTEVSADILKVGLDDARARHAAVVNLILFTDSQALGLLRLYVPIAIATASGAVASFSSGSAIPKAAGIALAAVTIVLIVACAYCFRAMNSSAINLPGRGAEFWRWAAEASNGQMFSAYMQNLQEKQVANNELNHRTAGHLARAKRCAVVMPMVALLAGALALAIGV